VKNDRAELGVAEEYRGPRRVSERSGRIKRSPAGNCRYIKWGSKHEKDAVRGGGRTTLGFGTNSRETIEPLKPGVGREDKFPQNIQKGNPGVTRTGETDVEGGDL